MALHQPPNPCPMTTPGLMDLLASLPEFRNRLDSIVTESRAFDVFRRIADTYAPTLTVSHTRAPVLKRILDEAMREGLYARRGRLHSFLPGNRRRGGAPGIGSPVARVVRGPP